MGEFETQNLAIGQKILAKISWIVACIFIFFCGTLQAEPAQPIPSKPGGSLPQVWLADDKGNILDPSKTHASISRGLPGDIEINPQIMSGALPSFDVSFRRPSGELASLRPMPNRRLNTDATLGVCVGTVDLTDGLDQFTNVDSMTGTLEERSLLRAVVDRDPTTIDETERYLGPGI